MIHTNTDTAKTSIRIQIPVLYVFIYFKLLQLFSKLIGMGICICMDILGISMGPIPIPGIFTHNIPGIWYQYRYHIDTIPYTDSRFI